ncbi:uncharacterized protein LOC130228577 [Danio aesculapii]|uniref:uncharacterized protein LOC130228577 n=1 Tax=Danio aesculapii TaxID=1142201 RepID=UPI0024C018F3|nr:uncharacterized protein LOC130228577 [Danio aesculapii]
MELQQRFSASENEYEQHSDTDIENRGRQKNETLKTEDIYQTLQFPPADRRTVNQTALMSEKPCKGNYVYLLFAVNILISVVTLAIVGLNYSHNQEKQPIKGQKEVWLLYDNVFYLFWSDYSNCYAAKSFCSKRNSSLAILSELNKGWLISRTNGKPFWILPAPSEESGSSYVDDEDHECGLVSSNADANDQEGFVCAKGVDHVSG